jgi:hypothetical protein
VKTISLLGSGAFEPWAEEVDRLALGSSAGDARAAVLLLGEDGAERRAHAAVEHFARIGVPVDVIRLDPRDSSAVSELGNGIADVCLIHLAAESAGTTVRTLLGTPIWDAVVAAVDRGAAFTASDGAMGALGDVVFDERARPATWDEWSPGLRLLEGTTLVPRWDVLGRAPEVQRELATEVPADMTLIGIDDRTALIGDGDLWQVKGAGQVQIRIGDIWNTYGDGAAFLLPSSVTVLPEADEAEVPMPETLQGVVVLPDEDERPKQEPDLLVG